MREVQEILRLIVNDLEKTTVGLDALSAQVRALRGERTVADLRDAVSLARQRNAGVYRGIRAKIDGLTAVHPT